MKIYMTSFEILKENYHQPGLVYFTKGIYDEQFKKEFIDDKKQRYKRWLSKSTILSKFLEEICEEIDLVQVFL